MVLHSDLPGLPIIVAVVDIIHIFKFRNKICKVKHLTRMVEGATIADTGYFFGYTFTKTILLRILFIVVQLRFALVVAEVTVTAFLL